MDLNERRESREIRCVVRKQVNNTADDHGSHNVCVVNLATLDFKIYNQVLKFLRDHYRFFQDCKSAAKLRQITGNGGVIWTAGLVRHRSGYHCEVLAQNLWTDNQFRSLLAPLIRPVSP
jgi:hypothetical protein